MLAAATLLIARTSYPLGGACEPLPPNPSIVVVGGTAGGVIAAIAAARYGTSQVLLLELGTHLGGMVSSGLGWTDGKPSGGIAAEFFAKAGSIHVTPAAAERIFDEMVQNETLITVVRNCGVVAASRRGGRIESIVVDGGATVTAKMFIDATYEGDLMALAGVNYTVGREDASEFNEPVAGGRLPTPPIWGCGCNWNFGNGVDGRNATSGAPLAMIHAVAPLAPLGAGDAKVQSYNFRLCLTKNRSNFRPLPKPTAYSPDRWELARRAVVAKNQQGGSSVVTLASDFLRPTPLPASGGKTDSNNKGGLSSDFVGGSWQWPDANRTHRAALWEQHKQYTLELFHFLRTDPSVGAQVREDMASWGLCADEFIDTEGWPHQLYVREARRLRSDFVFSLSDRISDNTKEDSIALGDYNIDGHMVQRVLLENGTVTNEGCLSGYAEEEHSLPTRFEIPFRVMVPRRGEAQNLLVTCAISATHVGSGPLRLEPQYMNMGHAAGVAAVMAGEGAVQDVSVIRLQAKLIAQGVQLKLGPSPAPRSTRSAKPKLKPETMEV
jgi:hypothetical protein